MSTVRRWVGRYAQKAIAIAAASGLLYTLDDVRQYWSAVETMGVVSAIDVSESCRENDSIKFCSRHKHVMVTYADRDVTRVTEISLEPSETFFQDGGRLSVRVRPVVGLQVPVVVVNAKPQLTRIAAYHRENRRWLWLRCLLIAALVWFAWNEKLPLRNRGSA